MIVALLANLLVNSTAVSEPNLTLAPPPAPMLAAPSPVVLHLSPALTVPLAACAVGLAPTVSRPRVPRAWSRALLHPSVNVEPRSLWCDLARARRRSSCRAWIRVKSPVGRSEAVASQPVHGPRSARAWEVMVPDRRTG